MATGGPIFVIGCEGGGLGVLRAVIDRHDRIAIAPETGFMRAERAHRFIPFWPFGARWHRRLGLTDEGLDEHLRAFYDGLFRAYAEREGKPRWGEATPWHLWHVEAIARLFPDAVFAAAVRHPAANVVSSMHRRELDFEGALRRYREGNTELLRQAARLGDRVALVRFEDLVLEPEATARELCEWLGEPWPEGALAGVDELDPDRVARWTPSIGDWRRARLAERAGPLAELLGYALEDPRPVPGEERRLLLGTDVAARLAARPGPPLAPPPVPLADRLYSPRELELRRVPAPPTATAPPLPPRSARLRRAAQPLARRLPRGVRRGLRAALRRGR